MSHASPSLPVVSLRPPAERDLTLLAGMRNDLPTQYALLAYPQPNSLDDVRRWLERRTTDPATLFAVIADAGGAAVGFYQIVGIDAISRHGSFGIGIAEGHRGRGIGRAALRAVIAAAAADGRLDKLVLDVAAANEPARRLYASEGFREVGTLRRHYRGPDGWWDVVVMERFLDDAAG